MKEAQIKSARHMEEFIKSSKFMRNLRKCKKIQRKENNKLGTRALNKKVETMYKSLDRHKQYSRINFLFIHGVTENERENTDIVIIEVLEKEMKEKISVDDIDSLTKKKQTRRRRQVQCLEYNFRKKKDMRGKAVSLKENLTKKRTIEIKIARETVLETFGHKMEKFYTLMQIIGTR